METLEAKSTLTFFFILLKEGGGVCILRDNPEHFYEMPS